MPDRTDEYNIGLFQVLSKKTNNRLPKLIFWEPSLYKRAISGYRAGSAYITRYVVLKKMVPDFRALNLRLFPRKNRPCGR